MDNCEKTLENLCHKITDRNLKATKFFYKTELCGLISCLGFIDYHLYGAIIPCLIYAVKTGSNLFENLFYLNNDIIDSNEYQKCKEYYLLLLKEIKFMLDEMNIKDPMEIFSAFYYMTLNGYLSIDCDFKADNVDNSIYHMGTSIISGVGVCRNLSSFLTDLLRVSGYQSYNVEMKIQNPTLYKLSNDHYQHSNISINEKATSKSESHTYCNIFLNYYYYYLLKNGYNHVSTLLFNDNNSYIMDPMNNTFYLLNSDGVYPYNNLNEKIITNLKREFDARKGVKLPKADSLGISNPDDLYNKYQNARLKCENSNYIFELFNFQYKELYKEILNSKDEFNKKYIKVMAALKKI